MATVLDMPNKPAADRDPRAVRTKARALRAQSRSTTVFSGRRRTAGESAPETARRENLHAQSSSLPAIGDADALARIFARRSRRGPPEDERDFSHNVEKSFPQCGKNVHHLRRPRAAVLAALASLEIALRKTPAKARPRLVVAHCGTVEELAWVRKMKRAGYDVWAETCPHYFLLTEKIISARRRAAGESAAAERRGSGRDFRGGEKTAHRFRFDRPRRARVGGEGWKEPASGIAASNGWGRSC